MEHPPFAERRHNGPDRRLNPPERRHGPFRGGRRAADLILATALAAGLAGGASAAEAKTPQAVRVGRRESDVVRVAPVPPLPDHGPGDLLSLPTMRFGVDMASVGKATQQGIPVSYGVFWVGPWTRKYGWGETEDHLKAARKRGVTPVVNWWYWGDDISPRAVEEGTRDKYHGVAKDRATWSRMSRELASRIARTMGDREAVVVLETEFNKNGIERYEPFDAYLAEQIAILHAQGNIKVVLGFGNWGKESWGRFDRAVAASDYLGIQLLQSSVRDAATYRRAPETLVGAARHLQAKFHKPSLIVDLALSSYGDRYEAHQAGVLEELFRRLPELKAAGVEGLIWRSISDDPDFDTANYHGPAERHWGLLRADGSAKPGLSAFLGGVRQETAHPTVAVVLPPGGKQPARAPARLGCGRPAGQKRL